jgi:peroxiredoxin
MKLNICIIAIAAISLLIGCQNKDTQESKKLKAILGNTTKLAFSNYKKDSIRNIIWSIPNPTFLVYTAEGELMTIDYRKKNIMNMTIDVYGTDNQHIQAVVFRKMTNAEMDALSDEQEEEQLKNEEAMDLMMNQTAPLFSAKDVTGNEVNLGKLKGKVVALNFWFINCHACVQEMPELNQIKKEFQGKDVEFIGLTFDDLPKTQQFLQKTTYDYRIIPNAKHLFNMFNISPCPVNLVIDKQGTIVFSELGYESQNNKSQNDLRHAIELALR